MGSLRFPGDPSYAFAPVQDPGRTGVPSPITGPSVLPLRPSQQRLQRCSYRGYRGASAPAVYASRTVLPPPLQDSLPAGWLAFTGWELNPLGRDERFPNGYIPSPFPGFILTLDGLEHGGILDQTGLVAANRAWGRRQLAANFKPLDFGGIHGAGDTSQAADGAARVKPGATAAIRFQVPGV